MQSVGNSFPKLNCSGQECLERDGCRRYEIRIADGHDLVGLVKVPRINWASFDVERVLRGSCENRIRMHEVQKNRNFAA